MLSIRKSPIPPDSLLYVYTSDGAYVDAYSTEGLEGISLAQFVSAFYTSPLFRLERLILRLTISKPSTDSQATQLADGDLDAFAAWRVEGRRANEILLCDISGRTRSWLKVEPISDDRCVGTRLFFGSAVVPVYNRKTEQSTLGIVFRSLLGFHRLYSVLLLYSAKLRISHTNRLTGAKQGVYR